MLVLSLLQYENFEWNRTTCLLTSASSLLYSVGNQIIIKRLL